MDYFECILKITLPMSVMIAALLLLSPIMRRAFTVKLRYYMWLLVALRMLFPFSPKFSAAVEIPLPQEAVCAVEKNNNYFVCIWLVGVLLILIWQSIGYFVFRHNINQFRKDDDLEVKAVFESFSCKKVKMITSAYTDVPLTVGFFKPTIVMPNEQFDRRNIEMILEHEMTHCRNHDCIYKLVLTVLSAVHWFNPLVHIMNRAAAIDIEINCDYDTTANKDSEWKNDYCKAIVDEVRKSRRVGISYSSYFFSSGRVLKKRIADVLDLKIKKRGITVLAAAIALMGISGGAVEYTTEKIYENTELGSAVRVDVQEKNESKDTVKSASVKSETAAATNVYHAKEKSVPEKKSKPKKIHVDKEVRRATKAESEGMHEETQNPISEENQEISNQSEFAVTAEDNGEKLVINFDEENKDAYSRAYKGNAGTSLYASVASGGGDVEIVDSKTGEVVAQGDGTASAVYSGGESYTVRVKQKNNSESAQVVIFGEAKKGEE